MQRATPRDSLVVSVSGGVHWRNFTLKVVVTSGVARIWCQGGTTIEASSGVGMWRGVRSPADYGVWGSVMSSPIWIRSEPPAAIAFSVYFRPQNASGNKKNTILLPKV